MDVFLLLELPASYGTFIIKNQLLPGIADNTFQKFMPSNQGISDVKHVGFVVFALKLHEPLLH